MFISFNPLHISFLPKYKLNTIIFSNFLFDLYISSNNLNDLGATYLLSNQLLTRAKATFLPNKATFLHFF